MRNINDDLSVSSAEEKLINGDFESFEDGIGVGWERGNFDKSIAQFSSESNPEYVHDGTYSQKITVSGSSHGTSLVFLQAADFTAGEVYNTKIYFRSSGSAVAVTVKYRDKKPHYDTAVAKSLPVGAEWQELTLTGGFPKDTQGDLYLEISGSAPYSLWLDSASMSLDETWREKLPFDNKKIDNRLFGMHVNKLGVHSNWPELSLGLMRLSDTGTCLTNLYTADGQWQWEPSFDRLDLYLDYIGENDPDVDILYTFCKAPGWPDVSLPPYDDPMLLWNRYVEAIGRRNKSAGDPIKYFEIWNEFDQKNFWNLSVERMVEYTKSARNILKAIDPDYKIVSPSVSSIKALDQFLSAGGGSAVDIIAFHLYPDLSGGHTPEDYLPTYIAFHDLITYYGIGDKPLWITEGALLKDKEAQEPDYDRSMLARHYLTLAMAGIKNFSWYFWEGYDRLAIKLATPCRYQFDDRLHDLCEGAELENSGAYRQVTPAGSAYSEISKWLTGKRITDVTYNSTNRSWQISVSDGSSCDSIAWAQQGRTQVDNRSAIYSGIVDMDGKKQPVSGTVTIGQEPVLMRLSGKCP